MNGKKAQGWSIDLIAASVIFITGIIIFYIYSINYPSQVQDQLDELSYEGKFISNMLLTEGYPENWNENNVVEIGILKEKEINQEKIEMFYNLSLDYTKTKSLLGIKNDFYFHIEGNNLSVNELNIQGIGLAPTNAKNIIRTSRLTIYNKKPTLIHIETWN